MDCHVRTCVTENLREPKRVWSSTVSIICQVWLYYTKRHVTARLPALWRETAVLTRHTAQSRSRGIEWAGCAQLCPVMVSTRTREIRWWWWFQINQLQTAVECSRVPPARWRLWATSISDVGFILLLSLKWLAFQLNSAGYYLYRPSMMMIARGGSLVDIVTQILCHKSFVCIQKIHIVSQSDVCTRIVVFWYSGRYIISPYTVMFIITHQHFHTCCTVHLRWCVSTAHSKYSSLIP